MLVLRECPCPVGWAVQLSPSRVALGWAAGAGAGSRHQGLIWFRTQCNSLHLCAQGLREVLSLAIKHLLGSHYGSSLGGKCWGTCMSCSHPPCPPLPCLSSSRCLFSQPINEAALPTPTPPALSLPHAVLREGAPGWQPLLMVGQTPNLQTGLSCGIRPSRPGAALWLWGLRHA